jgi:signal transduction histidine kinase
MQPLRMVLDMQLDSSGVVRNVLIVDRDEAFSAALAAYLSKNDYRVAVAAPSEMLRSLAEFNAAIVLCDIDNADDAAANLPAQVLKARPDSTCIPMARRSDLRRAAPAFSDGTTRFVNKSEEFSATLKIIDNCFKILESRTRNGADAEALHDTNEQGEEANHAKLEFLAKVSHELRTPLNAIIGFSELIIRDALGPLGNEQYRSYIEDIHMSGRHLLDVINDILDFAKAEAGKLLLQESDVDVSEVVASLKRLIGPRARDAGIELNDSIAADLPRLWCDERKLKQMLLNLLTNAVKFTQAGGRIEITACEGPEGFTCAVIDTGLGIADADLERVLEPFVQADTTHGRRQEGTGLGLPLVKAMIEIHGGRIDLQSEVHKGTIARLIFPPERIGQRVGQEASVYERVAGMKRSAV